MVFCQQCIGEKVLKLFRGQLGGSPTGGNGNHCAIPSVAKERVVDQ